MKELTADYKIDILSQPHELRESTADIRVVYLVDGSCVIHESSGSTRLGKTDMLLINSGNRARVEIADESVLALLSIDYYKLCNALELTSLRFYLNSQEDTGQKYTLAKAQMQDLLMTHVGNGYMRECKELGCFYLLLHTLLSNFALSNEPLEGGGDGDPRIARIINYIHTNYGSNLSLNEIADKLYLSTSSASRLFQKATGEGFNSYIKKVRLDHVRQDLLETTLPIVRIAVDNGFSTPSALNKSFKSEFGITPTEFREAHWKEGESALQTTEKSKERILQILQEDQKLHITDLEQQLTVRADAGQMAPWKKWENRLLNVGPAHVLSSANMQRQVLLLANKLEVEFLRIWNPFSSRMMIRGSKGEYNFTFIDEVMDFCVDNKLKLFIDLAQRREVAMASERSEIYSSDEQTEFESAESWLDFLRSFLSHIRHRYHERVVGNWIFELSFFLNEKPYYSSDDYRSRAVWEQGYELIKRIIPSARVAGPGLITNSDQEQVELLVDYFLSTQYAPDIFTSINFPYTVSSDVETNSIFHKPYKKTASRYFLEEQTALIQEHLKKSGFRGEYWVTEWGNSLANRNYIQDSCFRGAFIVENVLRNHGGAAVLGIFYASDLLNVYYDTQSILSGSAGLLSRDGICKPAYYAYRFLSRLGKYRIQQTENCIITAENPGDIRILCCNNKALGPKYYLAEENSYRPDELDKLFLNTDTQSMNLVLSQLQNGEIYLVRQKTLNAKKGSILDKWIDFECTNQLKRSDLEYLERVSAPEITAERMVALDGVLHIGFRMEPNEIRLITVSKE